jgi:hypothetical protein
MARCAVAEQFPPFGARSLDISDSKIPSLELRHSAVFVGNCTPQSPSVTSCTS